VVGGDAQQPRRKLRLTPKAVDRLEHGDEDFLRDVLGLLAVPDHPVDQAEDLVSVKLNDLAERLFVAVLEARDEEPLGDAHRVGDPFSPRAGGSQTERRLHVASDNRITRRFPAGAIYLGTRDGFRTSRDGLGRAELDLPQRESW